MAKLLKEVSGVLVRVPRDSCAELTYIAEHFPGLSNRKSTRVPRHWEHIQVLEKETREHSEPKQVFTRNFFGLNAGDFGTHIIATVRVYGISTGDIQKATFVDIIKTHEEPSAKMKLVIGIPQRDGDIFVGKLTVIRFLPYLKHEKCE